MNTLNNKPIPNEISSDVVLNNIMLSWDIQTIKALGRANKYYNENLIANLKDLWARTTDFSPNEIKINPLLPLFKIIDGLNKNNHILELFNKNKELFNDNYTKFYLSKNPFPYRFLTAETCNDKVAIQGSNLAASEFINANLPSLVKLQADVNDAKTLISLFYRKGLSTGALECFIVLVSLSFLVFASNLWVPLLGIGLGYIVKDFQAMILRAASDTKEYQGMVYRSPLESIDIKNINEKVLKDAIDTGVFRTRLISIVVVIFIGLLKTSS